ncbi:MAG: glycerol acyltransferase, partial [Bacteroidales bacterium]|nr:glycerol acyltransferase [Bacteroidales bacterium]
MEDFDKTIDIEKVIKGSQSFLSRLPGFMIRMIKNLICEDEMNLTIYRSRHLDGLSFIEDVLKGWGVTVLVRGEENIPGTGRFIFAANHPLGGIDALSLYKALSSHFTDIVSPANQLLNHIPNLRPLFIGLDVFGKTSRETAKKLDEVYASGKQIVIFPAGEVSRRKKGKISDIEWQKSFVTKAVQHKRDIVPVHISGRNSGLFYTVANLRKLLGIRMYVETVLLPREMMRKRNSSVTI